jgi:hypothetical protein
MTVAQLNHFVTALEDAEEKVTVLAPRPGAAPGERLGKRFYIVDGTSIGNAVVNNVPSVALLIKSGNSTKAYALNRQQAESLVHMVGDELPSLDRLTGGEH